jgi:pilus assembly protein CpaB
LILAVILAAVAAVLAVVYLRSATATSGNQPSEAMLHVVVATRDIAVGQVVKESMVELKGLPADAVIQGAATSTTQVVGQALRYPVARGEQLNNLRILKPTESQALSFQIPRGLRAVTVQVNVNNTPAALAAPGDFVDLLVNGPVKALRQSPQLASAVGSQNWDENSKVTVTLLQNVQILAVQREYVANGAPYDSSVRGPLPKNENVSYVTMALTPEQGQLVWQAVASEVKITLSLRSFGDEETLDLQPLVPMVQVVVAAQNISGGQEITESMVELVSVPDGSVIRNAATSKDQVVGQILRISVIEGAPLSNLRQPELAEAEALSFQIPQGLRGLTIPVSVSNTPAALIAPGDYVDVVVALDILSLGLTPPGEGELASSADVMGAMTLLQNVRVLAVQMEYVKTDIPYDASIRGPLSEDGNVSYLTLAVTPEQAQLVWLAVAKEARMTVTLRPYQDSAIRSLPPATEPIRRLP